MSTLFLIAGTDDARFLYNLEFLNNQHTALSFVHHNSASIHHVVSKIVFIFRSCVYFHFAIPIILHTPWQGT